MSDTQTLESPIRTETPEALVARLAQAGRAAQIVLARMTTPQKAQALLAAADAALYRAKAEGRDRLACAVPATISPLPIAAGAVPV